MPEITQGNFASGSVRKQPLTDFGLIASFSEPLSLVAPGGGLKQYVDFCLVLKLRFVEGHFDRSAYNLKNSDERHYTTPSRKLELIVQRGFNPLLFTYSEPPRTIDQFSYTIPDNLTSKSMKTKTSALILYTGLSCPLIT